MKVIKDYIWSYNKTLENFITLVARVDKNILPYPKDPVD
jgi:hypothetical protein